MEEDNGNQKSSRASEGFKKSLGVKKGGIGSILSGGFGLRKSKSKSTKVGEEILDEPKVTEAAAKPNSTISTESGLKNQISPPAPKQALPPSLEKEANNSNRSSVPKQGEGSPNFDLPPIPKPELALPFVESKAPEAVLESAGAPALDRSVKYPPPVPNLQSRLPPLPQLPSIPLPKIGNLDAFSAPEEPIPTSQPTRSVPASSGNRASPPVPRPFVPLPGIPSLPKVPLESVLAPQADIEMENEDFEEETEEISEEAQVSSSHKELDHLEDVHPTPQASNGSVLARVLEDYEANDPGELSLSSGDVITVLESEGEYWKGDYHGKVGIFPAQSVEIIQRESNSEHGEEENTQEATPKQNFKLAAYGVKKGGLGGLFSGGIPQLNRGKPSAHPTSQNDEEIAHQLPKVPTRPSEHKLKPVISPPQIKRSSFGVDISSLPESSKSEYTAVGAEQLTEPPIHPRPLAPEPEEVRTNQAPDSTLPAVVEVNPALAFFPPKVSALHKSSPTLSPLPTPTEKRTLVAPVPEASVLSEEVTTDEEPTDNQGILNQATSHLLSAQEELEVDFRYEPYVHTEPADEPTGHEFDTPPSSQGTAEKPEQTGIPLEVRQATTSVPKETHPVDVEEENSISFGPEPVSRNVQEEASALNVKFDTLPTQPVSVENDESHTENEEPTVSTSQELPDFKSNDSVQELSSIDQKDDLTDTKHIDTNVLAEIHASTSDIEARNAEPNLSEQTTQQTEVEVEETRAEARSEKDASPVNPSHLEVEQDEPKVPQPTSLQARLAQSDSSPKLSNSTLSGPAGRRPVSRRPATKATTTQSDLLEKAIEADEAPEPTPQPEVDLPKANSLGRFNKIATPFAGMMTPPKLPVKPVMAQFQHLQQSKPKPELSPPSSTGSVNASDFPKGKVSSARNTFTEHLNKVSSASASPTSSPIPSLQERLKEFVRKEIEAVKLEFQTQLEEERKLRQELQLQVEHLKNQLNNF